MNWIKSVRLENFQSHVDTTINFDKQLNVIVGQSDSGKTAILRGLRWVLFNQPRGSDFLRVGADVVRVSVELSNGKTIIRERTATKNRYIIREAEKEDFILEGFGVHVPKEVLEAHEIKPLRVERDQEIILHIGQQLDGPFLLEETPSFRARTIGRISGAHYLDMAIRDTSSDIAKLKQQITFSEKEIEQLKEKLTPFAELDKAKERLERAQAQANFYKQQQEKLASLKAWKQKYGDNCSQLVRTKTELEKVSDHGKWEHRLLQLQHNYELVKRFRLKREQLTEIMQGIATCQAVLEKTKDGELGKKRVEQIEKKYIVRSKLWEIAKQLSEIKNIKEKAVVVMNKTTFATIERTKTIRRLEQKNEQLVHLQKLREYYFTTYQKAEQLASYIHKLHSLQFVELKKEELLKKVETLTTYQSYSQKLGEIVNRIKNGSAFLEEIKEEESDLRRQYENALFERGSCPTCGSSIDKMEISTIFDGNR